jgi:hypothetical protein
VKGCCRISASRDRIEMRYAANKFAKSTTYLVPLPEGVP